MDDLPYNRSMNVWLDEDKAIKQNIAQSMQACINAFETVALPYNPSMDVWLDEDKAVKQNIAQRMQACINAIVSVDLPYNPGVDVLLDDDEAVKQNEAKQSEHAQAISHYNVARHHCNCAEDGHPNLVCAEYDSPEHEKPAATTHSHWYHAVFCACYMYHALIGGKHDTATMPSGIALHIHGSNSQLEGSQQRCSEWECIITSTTDGAGQDSISKQE